MSTPLNHHIVSQTHIKNFFNVFEKKIYVYDKHKKNFFSKSTTKTLFSEIMSNSKWSDDKIDHDFLERDLNLNFEKDFAINTQIVEKFVDDRILNEKVIDALIYFAKYGVIGELRTPRFKKHVDETLFDAMSILMENSTESLKNEYKDFLKTQDGLKYTNFVDYSNFADNALEKMGGLIFEIVIPKNENDFYLLPDFPAAISRSKINEYFNPDVEEISYIGIPLTSKIYIHFRSEKIFNSSEIPTSKVSYTNSEGVKIYNQVNFDHSEGKVACENEDYLKKFIAEYNSNFA